MARWGICFLVLLSALAALAQVQPRDYVISAPRVSLSADGRTAVASFVVSNQGGDAASESQLVIAETISGEIRARETLPALGAGDERAFEIALALADLPDGDVYFQVAAGIDEYELEGSPIARNNVQIFRVNQDDIADARADTGAEISDQPQYDVFVPLVNLGIDFFADGFAVNGARYTTGDLLRFAGIVALALFCLWLLSLLLRLIFRGPPKFDAWQPPYAVNTWHDPNSALGRRQAWQFHAQNCLIDAPGQPGQVTVIKRLTDEAGASLGGWTVTALRTAQYDVYGRISRSEVIMPGKIGKRLRRIARRAPGLTGEQLNKALRPIARSLVRQALNAIEKQNRALPLALDMRFEGEPDLAQVHFELYQYRAGGWRMIDQWQPELGLHGSRIPEQLTFSLNGQLPGESYREFKTRLGADMTQLLLGLFDQGQSESAALDEASQPAEADTDKQAAQEHDEPDAS